MSRYRPPRGSVRGGFGAPGSARYRFDAWRARSDFPADAFYALPGILAVAVFVVFAASEGGFLPTTWYPGAIFLTALAAVAIGTQGARLSAPRPVLAALAFLAAFVVWSFLSITWADDQAIALSGANRALLALSVFSLFALWPWRSRGAAVVVGLFGVAVAIVGIVVLSNAADAPDPFTYVIKGRFAEPVGYPNGNAAIFLLAAWPLLYLSSRREVHWLLRGVTLAATGVLVEIAVLSQSRGSLLAGALALVLYLAIVPGRVRSLISIGVIAVAVVLSLDALLDVFSVAEANGNLGAAFGRASDAVITSLVALFGVGAAIGIVDRRAPISDLTRRRGSTAIVVAAVALGGGASVIAATGNPIDSVRDSWDEFKAGQPSKFGESRFSTGLGSARYEYWRVAMHEFRDHPIAGIGSENFAIPYVQQRKSPADEPLFVHSFPVGVLSQTGLIGAALLGGFLGFALIAFWRAQAATRELRRGVGCAAFVAFAYWFAHASGEWLWEIPGAAAPAFAWLGLSVGLTPRAVPEEGAAPASSASRFAVPALAAAATILAITVMLAPWLAASEVDAAEGDWTQDRHLAFDRLDRAHDLNRLSGDADVTEGTIASIVGDRARARAAFARAVERTPKSWFARQQLGLENALAGDRRGALAQLRTAAALNPLDELTGNILQEVRRGGRPSPTRIRARLETEVCSRSPTVGRCR